MSLKCTHCVYLSPTLLFKIMLLFLVAIPMNAFIICFLVVNLYCACMLSRFSRVRFFAIPRTAARQASMSFPISWSLLKLMSIESVIPSNHLILSCPYSSCLPSFPASGSFSTSWLFTPGGQSTGTSVSAPVFPMNIQGWFLLGLTDWSPYFPRDFQESSPSPQFKSNNSSALRILYG